MYQFQRWLTCQFSNESCRTHLTGFACLIVLTGVWLSPASRSTASLLNAQESETSDDLGVTGSKETLEPKSSVTNVTAEEINARETAISESSLDEEAKAKARELLLTAREFLASATASREAESKFDLMIKSAPDELKRLEERLKELDSATVKSLPEDETLDTLTIQLKQLESELESKRQERDAAAMEEGHRRSRRAEIPSLLKEAEARIAALVEQIESTVDEDNPASLVKTNRMVWRAAKEDLEQQIQLFEREIEAYDATSKLLPIQNQVVIREVLQLEDYLNRFQKLVQDRREAAADDAARAAKRDAAQASRALKPLAAENQRLAEGNQAILDLIKLADTDLRELDSQLEAFSNLVKTTQEKIKRVGLTEAMGLLLRQQRQNLPETRQYHQRKARRNDEIRELQLSLIELDTKTSEIYSGKLLRQTMDAISVESDPLMIDELDATAKELLLKQKDYLNTLKTNQDVYFERLVDIDTQERQLFDEVVEYQQFIDSRILWIRSADFISFKDIVTSFSALAWFVNSEGWLLIGQRIWSDVRHYPIAYLLMTILMVCSIVYYPRIRRRIERLGFLAARKSCQSFRVTMESFGWTLLLSARIPLILLGISWLIGMGTETTEFMGAIAVGLASASAVLFAFEVLRFVAIPHGLANDHFGWSSRMTRRLRLNLVWYIPVIAIVSFISSTIHIYIEESWKGSLERISLITGLLAAALFVKRALVHSDDRTSDAITDAQQLLVVPTGFRLQYLWYAFGVFVPILLAGLSIFGYQFTAYLLTTRLLATFWLLVTINLLGEILRRWIKINRRRLETQRSELNEIEAKNSTASSSRKSTLLSTLNQVDLLWVGQQSQKLLRTILLVVAATGIWLLWDDTLPALQFLDNVKLWKSLVDDQLVDVTLKHGIIALLIFVATFFAIKNLPGFLELFLLQRLPMVPGTRYAVITIVRYSIFLVGAVIAFRILGIRWSQYQWLVAAATVGLGFGLQEIFANLVSGFILLTERPIRVGDVVTIEGVTGTVSKIHIRATIITNWDRQELIVPNKDFVTSRVLNWTLSNTINRVVISVNVAPDTDTDLARETLLKVAGDNPGVLVDPSPLATFEKINDGTLTFVLRCYLPDMSNRLGTIHELNSEVRKELTAAGVRISPPRHDVHFTSDMPPIALSEFKSS